LRSTTAITISWTLWGVALYLYSPYLTVFLKGIVNEDFIGILYVLSSVVGLFYALLPILTSRIKEVTITSLIISGLGLILLAFSNNIALTTLSILLYSMYWASVPVFYLLMRDEVAKVWAISMTPALIIPFIGGKIVDLLGLKGVFIASGVFMALTALPLINVNIRGREGLDYEKEEENRFIPLIFTILPLSIALPYLYVNTPLSLIPVIYALGQGIGMAMALFLSKARRGLAIALSTFALISLNNVIPFGAMFYGISEALTALGIDGIKIRSLRDSVKVTLAEILIWLVGYALATALFVISPFLPTVYASLIAILFALITLFTIPRLIKIKIKRVYPIKGESFFLERLNEGIFPYFKFA